MFERVLVGLDESEHSRRTLEAAKELAKLADADVRVLHIREGETQFGRGGPLETESDDLAKAFVDGTVKELVDDGLRATGTVRASLSGHISEDVLDEAKEWGASMIVLGSHGMSELKGILVGSTTHRVLNHSELPLLVVR